MINRPSYIKLLRKSLKRAPVVALLGPRQCGKTTLARLYSKTCKQVMYFDLENMKDLQRLDQPALTLEPIKGLIIIDEVQKKPELFALLRVLVDRNPLPARFLLLGSASPELIKHTSESLAGRIEFIELGGFDTSEVGTGRSERLWIRGRFPRSFLAKTEEDSWVWRINFIKTFLERDIPQLGIKIPSIMLNRFWRMLAHYHGQIWNASEISKSLGISDKTVRNYLDILASTFMVRILPPWHVNLKKRQIKAPKIYIRDTGIFHCLQDIPDKYTIMANPKLGASWEGFMLEEILRHFSPADAYFWATHSGVELDLMFAIRGKRYGFEFKWSDAPKFTNSIKVALEALNLKHIYVIYPGKESYPIDRQVTVIAADNFREI